MEGIRRVLFEPWGLGDALIAAAILRETPDDTGLACQSRWHPLLRAAFDDGAPLHLIEVDLPYTSRAGQAKPLVAFSPPVDKVLSIRGDLRDWRAARRMFPRAKIRMTGWLEFVARRSAIVDRLYSAGCLKMHSHYRLWADLAGIAFDQIEARYQRSWQQATRGPIVLHIGAQWRSKQYPQARRLKELLEAAGHRVLVAAGPSDLLPDGISESQVLRASDRQLVEALRAARAVIANDSGPMHLAALLGRPTLCVARIACLSAWLPPAAIGITSSRTPRGHRPHHRYTSDQILDAWPSASTVADELTSALAVSADDLRAA